MTNGRPSKYKPEFDEMLIKHMSQGMSFESFAGTIDVCFDTLYEWLKIHPSFSEAKRLGVSKSLNVWEKILTSAATGNLKDHNMTGIVFSMKNKFPAFWRDRKEVVADIKIQDIDKEQARRMALSFIENDEEE